MEVPYVIGVIVILMLILGTFEHIRMQRLSGERGEVDICKYAKSFDYRSVDTKIMREVWNELHLWLGKYDGKAFPIKPKISLKILTIWTLKILMISIWQ